MNYLAASIAESAENRQRALFFYEKVKEAATKKGGVVKLDPGTLKGVEDRIAKLQSETQPTIQAEGEEALRNIRDHAAYAVNFYNNLFGTRRDVPPIELLKPDSKTPYVDLANNAYYVPPQVQYLPDVIYQQMAYPFIQERVDLPYFGQSGAILTSYAQILASLVKQRRLGQSAQEANWVLVEGGVAWLKNEDILKGKDKSPLFSLKAPGTAYNDPIVGRDPQPAHMRDYKNLQEDNGGVHINTGILNKAFYEVAIRLGSDKTRDLWLNALSKLASAKMKDFRTLAQITFEIAGENTEEQRAVREAWAIVGLDPMAPTSPGGSGSPTPLETSSPSQNRPRVSNRAVPSHRRRRKP